MKRLLFSFIILYSCLGYGQNISLGDLNLSDPQSVIFDFTSPSTLTPEVVPSPDPGSSVDVTSSVFTEGVVSLGFHKLPNAGASMAHLFTFYNPLYERNFYSLKINSGTQLEFNIKDAVFKSIEFIREPILQKTDITGIGIDEGLPGHISQQDRIWYCDEDCLTNRLLMSNRSYATAELELVKVNYYFLKALYEPVVDLDQKESYNSFSSLKLTFNTDVKYVANEEFLIQYRGRELSKYVSVNGKDVTITLNETVIDDGTVEIKIPAGCFVDEKGYYNKNLTYSYEIIKKRDTFVPDSYTPENESHVDFLLSGEIGFTFSGAISEVDENLRFRLFKEGQPSPVCLLKPVRGEGSNTVKLEFVEAVSNVITDNGRYTIVIPEKSFYNYKGDVDYESWNPEFTINYALGNIEELIPSVTPTTDIIAEEISGLTLKFDKPISYVENDEFTVKFNDDPVEFDITVDDKTVSITFETISTDGELAVHIPASSFVTTDFFANKALDYVYTIKTAASKKKDEARQLLAQTGVGYPTEDSPAYVALKTLVENNEATVEDLDAAIAALYAETKIELPANGEFYKISAVNTKGKTLYVAIENGNVAITDDVNSAAVFETINHDNEYIIFKSMDGKYLPVLTASESKLTDIITEVNKLKLNKLAITDKEKETYGLMTMYGKLGENDLGGFYSTYAVINFESKSLPEATTNNPYYDEKYSSAIRLVPTDKLDALVRITPRDIDCQRVGTEYKLIIKFDESMHVALNEASAKVAVSLMGGNETTVHDMSATGNVDEFVVNLGSKSPGDYTFTIPAKALKCIVDGSDRFADKVVGHFNIEDILTADFFTSDRFFVFLKPYNMDVYYFCEDLNDFGFKVDKNDRLNGSDYSSLFNDTTMTFIRTGTYLSDSIRQRYIANCDSINELIQRDGFMQSVDTVLIDNSVFRVEPYYSPKDLVIAPGKRVVLRGVHFYQTKYGRFEYFKEYNDEHPDEIAIKIEFDDGPILPGELKDDDYVFYVEQASFGDANFARYLEDQNSVPARKCVVNPKFHRTITVDATLAASGIKDAVAGETGKKTIYDITGRKVQDMSHPGVYIVNGRKVLVK